MWERFTKRARRVVFFAQERTHQCQEALVTPEHLLWGLLHEDNTVAGRLLLESGVSLETLRRTVEQLPTAPVVPPPQGEIGLSLPTKRLMDLAYDEALQLTNTYIGTEHLLLGFLRMEGTPCTKLLTQQGVSLEAVRALVRQLQDEDTGPDWARLTERARRALFAAQEEAVALGQSMIATEHLLLGLTREHDSVAASLLKRLGFSLEQVRTPLERHLRRGAAPTEGDPKLGHACKRVLLLAQQEAQRLGNTMVGTEHVLLGLLREGSGIAGHTLERLGIRLEAARQEVRWLQAPTTTPPLRVPAPAAPLRYSPATEALFPLLVAEAQALGEHYASTEHLLLALLRQPHPEVVGFLASFSVAPERVLSELARQIPRNLPPHTESVALTPRGQRALELAYVEAQTRGSALVEPLHLLLGLLREGDGLAGRLLNQLGVQPSSEALAARLRALGAEALRLAPQLASLSAEEFRRALLGENLL